MKQTSFSAMRFVLALVAAMLASSAFAHGGGTDSRGCHYDHRTGGYHCH